jgi:hypothetical protein
MIRNEYKMRFKAKHNGGLGIYVLSKALEFTIVSRRKFYANGCDDNRHAIVFDFLLLSLQFQDQRGLCPVVQRQKNLSNLWCMPILKSQAARSGQITVDDKTGVNFTIHQ